MRLKRKLVCTTCNGFGMLKRKACRDCAGHGFFETSVPDVVITLTKEDAAKMLVAVGSAAP